MMQIIQLTQHSFKEGENFFIEKMLAFSLAFFDEEWSENSLLSKIPLEKLEAQLCIALDWLFAGLLWLIHHSDLQVQRLFIRFGILQTKSKENKVDKFCNQLRIESKNSITRPKKYFVAVIHDLVNCLAILLQTQRLQIRLPDRL